MRRILFILAGLTAGLALVGSALAAPKILTRDGSLVIQGGEAKQAKKSSGSEDTLYDLLGQEVQVYIFNNRTRVWPRVYGQSSAPAAWQGRLTPRDPRVEALIGKYSQMYGVDPTLVRAVMRHESGFNPAAVSPKGAQGLMQLMPGTAALMGVKDPFDPEQNIAGGVGYLRRCLDRFQHNVPLAVAAYNAGPESVARCGTIPPYQETQVFVNNVMGSYTGQSGLPAAKAAPAAPGKDAQPGKKVAKPIASSPDQAPEVRRRPRPKIIEVRSYKIKPQDIAAETE
ncbi:MAG: lytic transglycosylase domain-containing protein [Desulfobaccales bacterium]